MLQAIPHKQIFFLNLVFNHRTGWPLQENRIDEGDETLADRLKEVLGEIEMKVSIQNY